MRTNGDISGDSIADRYTVAEAAGVMGITAEAVRQRLKRGTLPYEKVDGTVYVLLDADRPRPNNGGTGVRSGESEALISQLRDEVAYLREESRRKDEIIMRQAMTMQQLTATPGEQPSQATEEPQDEPEPPAEGSNPGGGLGGQERRPWWRRIFD